MKGRHAMPQARTHDGSTIDFEVQGEGPTLLLPLDPAPVEGARAEELRAWGTDPALGHSLMTGLADLVRVVAFPYENHVQAHPKPDTLTADNVAADMLAVADAAGAERFAYYGYSWLALTGLQLALRTDRLSALAMGGFPPLGGPYAEMLRVTEVTHERAKAQEDGQDHGNGRDGQTGQGAAAWGGGEDAPEPVQGAAPEAAEAAEAMEAASLADYDWSAAELTLSGPQTRQFVTLYRSLAGFDDRAAQARLAVPRLCFAGSADVIDYDANWGGVRVDIAGPLHRRRAELEELGWRVRLLDGLNHMTAMQPTAVLPVLRPWLAEVLGSGA
ncbi:alpha/beta hydrolase [Streptomonospora sp. S1-112]|uniref:Alpha/beta hydrolase n=1 Tax=Streptomonospora mangrovi TaxID=2883123 RepID=A0A9X3NTQ7_9ACTN|nr:alpha/beta hydrolase [Streptomonospora mangrovi]MDA0568051.1 alpha/beta hydrolase [Streptomonospora mangrovi]